MKKSPDQGYWRSLEDLGNTPAYRRFADAEFPEEAQVPTDALSRRRFLQLMGASVAMAGAAGCRWPEERIVPFAARPEGTVPGAARSYATAMDLAGKVGPLLVTSHDGRPLKVEGNPDHPLSGGAADTYAQAAILEMYDPDRSAEVMRRRGGGHAKASWDDFLAWAGPHFEQMRARRGRGLAILAERSASPTLAALQARLRDELPEAGWFEYEPLSRDNERLGTGFAFGSPHKVHLDLARADVIACFDADLFGDHPAALRNARDFALGRRAEDGGMNRLYVAESCPSSTGAMADHRIPLATSLVPDALYKLAAELFLHQGVALPAGLETLRDAFAHADGHGHAEPWLPALARDLAAHRGRSLVAVGPRMPDHVHALAHLINLALDNAGRTVAYSADAPRGLAHGAAAADVADGLDKGRIDTLLVLGGNPAFDAPADLGLDALLAKAPHSVRLGHYEDETSAACGWHLPRAHFLESWNDVRDADGRYTVAQPLISPLYGGWTPAELMSLVLDGEKRDAHAQVRETAAGLGARGDAAWKRLLRDGFLPGSEDARAVPGLEGRGLIAALSRGARAAVPEPGPDNLEVVFGRDPALYDGRFANNGWLQELPDFMTKLTWDNAALVGVATAEALGLKHGDLVELELDGRSLEIAVYVLPGHAPWSVTLTLGHGRTRAGRVGTGTGFRTYALRSGAALDGALGLRLSRTGRTYELASTQDHHAIDPTGAEEREKRSHTLVVEGDLDEYEHHPDFASHRGHHPPLVSLWEERAYEGRAWGMTVDLNACIGCNACVTACQAENNIPVVGKDQVALGREMHWLRIDRYFQGDPDEPRVAHQPVACVHCELAPCEQVCPVGATMHSEEGLNVMAYNRCVGTRYCSNNCPYKVRRFNFFNNNKDIPEVTKLAFNPEVSLRARGVMEKCTYCVQRIEAAKIMAKNEGREVRDGEVVVACQQTCPTQAIAFGDLNDPDSDVARTTANSRAYHTLAELNIKPRTAYLARLRNPNPELVESTDGHAAH